MENEVREVTYLSVALMLIATVIGFAMFGINMSHSMANMRNKEVTSNEKIEEYREFNGYDGQTILGDDVIELIRGKYDTGIDIFVDYRENKSTHEEVGDGLGLTCDFCKADQGDHRVFNLTKYDLHRKAPAEFNYFEIAQTSTAAQRNDLRNWFPADARYRAYLIYNSQNPVDYYTKLIENFDINKGKFPNTESGQIEALDSGIRNAGMESQVTGVCLVNLAHLLHA